MVRIFLTTENWDSVRKVRRQLEELQVPEPNTLEVDRDGKIFLETSLDNIIHRVVRIGLIERLFLCLHQERLTEEHDICKDGPNYQLLQEWLRNIDWASAFNNLDVLHGGNAPRSWTVFSKRQGAKKSAIRAFDRLLMQQNAREALYECLSPLRGRHDHTNPGLMIYIYVTSALGLVAIPVLQRRVKQGYFPHKGLHHSLCWGMAYTAKLRPKELVLDPMAGKAVVLLEAAAFWPSCRYLASEADSEQVAKAKENLSYAASRGVLPQGTSSMALLQADCRRIPLADASVDVVLSDLPWGRQYGAEESNVELYAGLLREVARVLKPGIGRAVLCTSATEGNDAAMYLAAASANIQLFKEFRFRFGGNKDNMRCKMYCFVKVAEDGDQHSNSNSSSSNSNSINNSNSNSNSSTTNFDTLFDFSCFAALKEEKQQQQQQQSQQQQKQQQQQQRQEQQQEQQEQQQEQQEQQQEQQQQQQQQQQEQQEQQQEEQEQQQEQQEQQQEQKAKADKDDKESEDFVWKGVKPLLQLYFPAREDSTARELVCPAGGAGGGGGCGVVGGGDHAVAATVAATVASGGAAVAGASGGGYSTSYPAEVRST